MVGNAAMIKVLTVRDTHADDGWRGLVIIRGKGRFETVPYPTREEALATANEVARELEEWADDWRERWEL